MAWFGKRKRRVTRLLVVEDEPLVAFDNEHVLSDAGYVVVGTVDRVADALRLLGDGAAVDLVVSDVDLADGSGMDLARAADGMDVPVLFVTGRCPDGADAVAAGCLAKPYTQRDLLAAIDAIDAVIDGRSPKRLPPRLTLFAEAGAR